VIGRTIGGRTRGLEYAPQPIRQSSSVWSTPLPSDCTCFRRLGFDQLASASLAARIIGFLALVFLVLSPDTATVFLAIQLGLFGFYMHSYVIVFQYINRVGLGERDAFECPLVVQRASI